MNKKALITGICGQDGAYLAELLLEAGYHVYGGTRRSSLDELYRLRVLGIQDKVSYINFDLTDAYNVQSVVHEGQFDEIYNLAAQSFVGASWDLPIQTSNVNAIGALYLLDSINRFSKHTKFYQASTSEMFGLIQEAVQSETTPFYPRSPYGVAKLFAHSMTVNYRESFGLHASSGILFNHESPLRGTEFVTKKITTQLAEIVTGRRTHLELGNLNAKRDWGFAKEYVVGMWKMLQQDHPDDYVLATGRTYTIRDFVHCAAAALDIDIEFQGEGLDEVGINKKDGRELIRVNSAFYRPAEVDVLIGDASKASERLNWRAATTLSELAELMVKFDLDALV